MTIEVMNLATGDTRTYCADSMTPELAVICAYAQGTRKDWNTWEYGKYAPLVERGRYTLLLGDWSTWQHGRPPVALSR